MMKKVAMVGGMLVGVRYIEQVRKPFAFHVQCARRSLAD